MKNILKKVALASAMLLTGVVPAFAEGESGSGSGTPTDTTKIVEIVNSVGKAAQDGVEAAANAATPYLTKILLAALGIALAFLIYKWLRRAMGR